MNSKPTGVQMAITTAQMGTPSTGVAAATYAAPLHMALGATAQAAATQMADVDVLAYPRRDKGNLSKLFTSRI